MSNESEEEFRARAGKAARLAAITTGGLLAFLFIFGGAVWAAMKIAGVFGLVAIIAGFAFIVLWFAAMSDLRDQRRARNLDAPQ